MNAVPDDFKAMLRSLGAPMPLPCEACVDVLVVGNNWLTARVQLVESPPTLCVSRGWATDARVYLDWRTADRDQIRRAVDYLCLEPARVATYR